MTNPEPVAWIDFAENDNIRLWTSEKRRADAEMALGRKMTPVYTAPPADAGMREALAFTREFIRGEQIESAVVGISSMQSLGEYIDAALTAPGATTKSDGGESFVTTNPDGSVTLDAYAGKSRDELKARCRELCQHLNEWQFIAMEAATAHGNCLSNVPENARTKIANMIEAYRDDDEPGPSDPSSTRSDVTALTKRLDQVLKVMRGARNRNEPMAVWADDIKAVEDARALLDQFEIRRK